MASSVPSRLLLPSEPSGGDRLLLFAVLGAGLASALLLLWALDSLLFAACFLAVFVGCAALILLFFQQRGTTVSGTLSDDIPLLKAAIDANGQAVAITDRAGRLVCAGSAYGEWFPGWPTPPELPLSPQSAEQLLAAGRAAWRDGAASAPGLKGPRGAFDADLVRAGHSEDHLVWHFRRATIFDLAAAAKTLIEGDGGRRLGSAGVMAALVDSQGRVIAANGVLLQRAVGRADAPAAGREFVELLASGADDLIRLALEGEDAEPLRLVQIPLEDDGASGATIFLLLDDEGVTAARPGARNTATVHVHALLAMLPLGLALAERDGRFLFMNEAFERAAGLPPGESVLYPGDLVVKEDKAAVSDAVRRFAAGQRHSGDLAVRLIHRPEEPVALTIAGAKGLGEAAVLLSLKDSSEETKLKR
ncbi:MAG: multi-sensor hybrid histidine kinase, partial [Sphingomonas bacterium]|nr:multi-sensor hybrid histidine kinase [Sphingomonas bacterium]